ncbi:hypothetical protein P3L10_013838 [Capsicum annuum]
MDKLRNIATKVLKIFVPEAVVIVKSELLAIEVLQVVDIHTRVSSPPIPLGTPFEEEIGVSTHDMNYVEVQKNYGIEEENEVDAVNLDEDDENIGDTPAVKNANVRFESVNLLPRPFRAPRARKIISIAW